MNVGDKVLILVNKLMGIGYYIFPNTIGTVLYISHLFANVEIPPNIHHKGRAYGQTWTFHRSELKIINYDGMVEPEFDLDDMELAEIIMEELSHEAK